MAHDPQTHLIGRPGENVWKLHKPRGKQAELTAPKAKPVALFVQGTWGAGQLERRTETKSISGLKAASLTALKQKN